MKKITTVIRGIIEFRLCVTWADPARTEENWYTELDEIYDRGRELAHRLTLRRWDEV